MSYAFILDDEIIQTFIPNWAFGDVCLTDGAQEIIEAGADLDSMLQRIMAGDYGLISIDEADHERTVKARSAGRRFVALFGEAHRALYFSMNDYGRTVVCRADER